MGGVGSGEKPVSIGGGESVLVARRYWVSTDDVKMKIAYIFMLIQIGVFTF